MVIDSLPEPLSGPVRDAMWIANAGGFRDIVGVGLGGSLNDPDDPLTASVVDIFGNRLALILVFERPCGFREEQVSLHHSLVN
jgi:hypothetical protein